MHPRQTSFSTFHRPSRSGIVLVETIGVMVVVASILSLSAVILQQAFRTHQQSLLHFRNTEQLQRVAERIRGDVHLSTHVDADEAGKLTLNTSSGNQIIYRLQGTTLSREVTAGENDPRIEDWRLPEGVTFQWTLEAQNSRVLLKTRVVDAKSPALANEWLACALEVVHDE